MARGAPMTAAPKALVPTSDQEGGIHAGRHRIGEEGGEDLPHQRPEEQGGEEQPAPEAGADRDGGGQRLQHQQQGHGAERVLHHE
jgi:hypothetical protein